MTHAFVVPFRFKGNDQRRLDNFRYVMAYLRSLNLGPVYATEDGRNGLSPFCRSAAMNYGDQLAFSKGATVVTNFEADMIIGRHQLAQGVPLAESAPGLVVPFTRYEALSPNDSQAILNGADPWTATPAHVRDNGISIGAVGTVSRETYESIGQWPEEFEGHAYDDNAIFHALEICAGPPRWVQGPARHLWHIPGAGPSVDGGDPNASQEELAATESNRLRYELYRQADTPERIRELTSGAS